MPFCRKCGFEVSAWMSFCPSCGASLALSTTKPRGYGYRVTSFLVPNTLLWVLLVFLWMVRFNAYGDVTWYSQFMWMAFGMAAGLLVGVAVTRKQLNTLTEKGELGTSLSTLLFILGGVLVFGALFLAAMLASPSLSSVIHVAVIDAILGAGISIIVARSFLLVAWERNHKMRLYQKWWSPRIYAVPKTDSS
jgi:hypothetical protein